MSEINLVFDAKASLGEGPCWLERDQTLYWVDITFKKLHAHKPADNSNKSWDLPEMPGAVVPREKGGLMLVLDRLGYCSFDLDTGEIIQEETNYRLFPNPTKNLIYIQNNQLDGVDLEINVYNSQGQLVERYIKAPNALIELATNQLTRGLYLINIRTEKGIVVRRFVKQ